MDLLRESRLELTAATLTRRHNVSLAVLKQFCGKSVPDIPSDTHTKTQGAEIQTIKPQFSSTRENLSFFARRAESVGARLVLEGSTIGSPLCLRNSASAGARPIFRESVEVKSLFGPKFQSVPSSMRGKAIH